MHQRARADLSERALEYVHSNTVAFCEVYQPLVETPAGPKRYVPYKKQVALLNDLDAGCPALVFKGRQGGLTTTVMLQRLRWCLEPGTLHLVVSATEKLAGELIRMARYAAENCQREGLSFPLEVVKRDVLELGFSNGSRIIGIAPVKEGGRSYSATSVLMDEVRALPWVRETWQSIAPTMTHGGKPVLVSTPDIEGSFFHERWLEVRKGAGPWRYHEIHWRDWPGRDDAWAAETRENLKLTLLEWEQEFELVWGSLESAIFDRASINRAMALAKGLGLTWPITPPADTSEKDVFTVGCDVAKGGAKRDSSVLVALDVRREPFVLADAEDLGKRSATGLEEEIEVWARRYNCKPWVDCTGIGWGIVGNLEVPAVGVNFTSGRAVTEDDLGFNVPREKLLSNLAYGLEHDMLAIPEECQPIILALTTAQHEKGKGLYVDWLDALALAFWSATEGKAPVYTPGMGFGPGLLEELQRKSKGGVIGDAEFHKKVPKRKEGQAAGYTVTYPGDEGYPGDPG